MFLAKLDKNDNIIGKIEKWEAHKKGILHRGFTVVLKYENYFILQHRKHEVFDGYLDLSFSSHPIYTRGTLQNSLTAIDLSLKREWNIRKTDLLLRPVYKGKVIYKAEDKESGYIEHEMDYIYLASVKKPPSFNPKYAYGFSLVTIEQLKNKKSPFLKNLAPWVIAFLDKELI